MNSFVIGVDLGQAQDYTAVCVVEHIRHKAPTEPDYMGRYRSTQVIPPSDFHCRHLARFALGTRYPAIVDDVAKMLANPVLEGATLVVDGTGVGRAVIDMFVTAGMNPIAITITGGDAVTRDGSYYRVPKRDLVGAVQVPLQAKRLKFAESLPLASTLVDEMLAFRVKITETAHDTYGSWREGSHDDLILSVMMATWWIQEQEKNTWSPEQQAEMINAFGWQG
jgi:hypothetical protein